MADDDTEEAPTGPPAPMPPPPADDDEGGSISSHFYAEPQQEEPMFIAPTRGRTQSTVDDVKHKLANQREQWIARRKKEAEERQKQEEKAQKERDQQKRTVTVDGKQGWKCSSCKLFNPSERDTCTLCSVPFSTGTGAVLTKRVSSADEHASAWGAPGSASMNDAEFRGQTRTRQVSTVEDVKSKMERQRKEWIAKRQKEAEAKRKKQEEEDKARWSKKEAVEENGVRGWKCAECSSFNPAEWDACEACQVPFGELKMAEVTSRRVSTAVH